MWQYLSLSAQRPPYSGPQYGRTYNGEDQSHANPHE